MKRLAVLSLVGVAAGAVVVFVGLRLVEGIRRPTRAPVAEGGARDASVAWNESRRPTGARDLSSEEREQLEQLEAIGYLTGSRQGTGRTGVTRYARDRVVGGLNLYTSGHMSGAILMDMDGEVLHRWRKGFYDIWPDSTARPYGDNTDYWRRIHLFPNGDVLVIFEGLGLAKLDRHSNVVWASPVGAHHDLEVRSGGDIWVLTRVARIIEGGEKRRPVLEDFVTVMDEHGQIQRQVSLLKALEESETHVAVLRRSKRTEGDIFHTNALQVLDGRLAEEIPAFRGGNVLFSILTFSTVAVLDMETEEVVWTHQGPFSAQHDPRIVDDGRLLLFNNHKGPGQSSVVELDPVSGDVVWEYVGTETSPLYSDKCGSARRLANGNTLVVESDNGRAFEVTRDKEIVWEFHSPHRAGEDGEYVATLFDLVRLDETFPTFLEPPEGR